jgi:hypothetical protein
MRERVEGGVEVGRPCRRRGDEQHGDCRKGYHATHFGHDGAFATCRAATNTSLEALGAIGDGDQAECCGDLSPADQARCGHTALKIRLSACFSRTCRAISSGIRRPGDIGFVLSEDATVHVPEKDGLFAMMHRVP